MKLYYQIIVMTWICCIMLTAGNTLATERFINTGNTTLDGRREYGNILICWKASTSEVSVNVTVTIGTALIGAMHFTPDTLQQSLDYSNPPQSATGTFIIEFNATGRGGKLYVEDLKWVTKSNEGNVTGLIGLWPTNP